MKLLRHIPPSWVAVTIPESLVPVPVEPPPYCSLLVPQHQPLSPRAAPEPAPLCMARRFLSPIVAIPMQIPARRGTGLHAPPC